MSHTQKRGNITYKKEESSMNASNQSYTVCRSIFQNDAEAVSPEKYTQLWIALINQIERGKQFLSPAH